MDALTEKIKKIRIADFDYPLPDERIAKFPLEQRDASKLLVYRHGEISQSHFSDLPQLLPEETLLLFNDTKVIQARLRFQKESGATIEIFCLEPWQMPVAQIFEERVSVVWKCLIGNNRRWKVPVLERNLTIQDQSIVLQAERLQATGDAWLIRFSWSGGYTFADVLEVAGEMPLPPYLHRKAEERDRERYQTVYAHHKGSVAAPTAGLHFTDKVFDDLKKRGIEHEFVTLHVGAGTFKPVSSELIGEHSMHTEQLAVTRTQIAHIRQHIGKPLIAVGTTAVRTVESLDWFGVSLSRQQEVNEMHIPQWMPYMEEERLPSASQSLDKVLEYMDLHGLSLLTGETQLMIAPGYTYRLINAMVTNFHQPKSTLLLLVCAMIGEDWKRVYAYALAHDFRFLSYGDSCLFLP